MQNLINKTNTQAKYNQRYRNKEQADSNQRGAGRGINSGKRGRVVKEYVQRTHGQRQRGEGLSVGGGGGGEEVKGKTKKKQEK